MGKVFGELYKLRGIIMYRISPFEQRAFALAISKGVPNVFRRIREEMFYVLPPFMIGYIAYDLLTKKHKQLMRKNPADYENDE